MATNILGVSNDELISRLLTILAGDGGASDIDAEMLKQQVVANASRRMEAAAYLIGDERTEYFVHFCSLLLEMYRVLERTAGQAEALDLVRQILLEPIRATVKDWLARRFDIDQTEPAAAFGKVRLNFKSRGEAVVGDSFRYEVCEDDEAHHFVHIKKCFFNDFFRNQGAPELTPVVCEFDNFWAEEMNSGPYNVRFKREGMLSLGDDACRFHFWRAEKAGSET